MRTAFEMWKDDWDDKTIVGKALQAIFAPITVPVCFLTDIIWWIIYKDNP